LQQITRYQHNQGTQAAATDFGAPISTAVLSPTGNWLKTKYSYTTSKFPSRISGPKITTDIGRDALGHVLWTFETPLIGDPRARCFNVSPDGRLEAEWFPEGNVVNYSYDDANRLVATQQGYPAQLPVWAQNCATELKRSGHSPPQAKPGTQPDLQTTRTLEYDDSGALKRMADGSGIAQTFVVDGFGRTIETSDGKGNK